MVALLVSQSLQFSGDFTVTSEVVLQVQDPPATVFMLGSRKTDLGGSC